jgi:hypothetical protein
MKGIPAQTVIDGETIEKLDEILKNGFGDTSVMKFLGEFNEFLEKCHLTVIGPDSTDKETIKNSYYLRTILDKVASGREKIEIVKSPNFEGKKVDNLKAGCLMQILIGSQFRNRTDLFINWLRISKLPDAWDAFSNNKKTTILVGGKKPIFRSWEDFGLQKFPVNSIVIVDPYLFQEADEMESNLPEIVKGLVDVDNLNSIIDLVFIVAGDHHKRFTSEEFIQKRIITFNSILERNFNGLKIKFSIGFVKGQYLHDRFIFTNYYFLDAGSGFNLYNKSGSFGSKKPNKVTLRFLSSLDAFEEFDEAVKNYCNVLFDDKALMKMEGSFKGNQVLNLVFK